MFLCLLVHVLLVFLFSSCGTCSMGLRCLDGYQGNPYLLGGCQDINECASPMTNNCITNCINTLGSYKCSCPRGSDGDGKKNGTGCTKSSKLLPIGLGSGLGSLFLLIMVIMVGIWLRRNRKKRREKFSEDSVAAVYRCIQFFDSSRVDQVLDKLDDASS